MGELLAANVPSAAIAVLVFLGLFGLVSFLRREKDGKDGRVHWRPIESLGVTVFIYFAAYFLSQIALGFGVSLFANSKKQSLDSMSSLLEGSVVVQFCASLLFYGLILVFVYLFLRLRQTKWSAIGWVRPRLRDVGYAIAGFGAYFISYVIIIQVVHVLFPGINLDQKQEIGFSPTSTSGASLLLVFFSLVVLPPLVEEILARGVLYSGLRTKLSFVWAAILTSIMFAAAHLQAGSGNALLWVAAVDTFTLSLVLVYLREKTGSLWPSITLHALKNCIAFAALFIFHVG